MNTANAVATQQKSTAYEAWRFYQRFTTIGVMETLRNRVEKRMAKLGLNASQLAHAMGHDGNGSIWSLLSGRTVTFRDMAGLSKALQTTTEWLLKAEGSEEIQDPIFSTEEFISFLGRFIDYWDKNTDKSVAGNQLYGLAQEAYAECVGSSQEEQDGEIRKAFKYRGKS